MADASTFIKLDRNILKWRWYQDANTFRVFVHLLLKANIEDHDFENITVHRGQVVTSYPALGNALNISERSARTAINHLKSTGEVTAKAYSKYSVITIVNYERYQSSRQSSGQSSDSQVTVKRQSTDRQVTAIKESKEPIKNEKNIRNNADAFEEFAQNDVMLLEALRSFEEMRKQIKKPLSDRAKVLLLNKLQTFPYQQWVDIINQSIMNSWQGIFPLEKKKEVLPF